MWSQPGMVGTEAGTATTDATNSTCARAGAAQAVAGRLRTVSIARRDPLATKSLYNRSSCSRTGLAITLALRRPRGEEGARPRSPRSRPRFLLDGFVAAGWAKFGWWLGPSR